MTRDQARRVMREIDAMIEARARLASATDGVSRMAYLSDLDRARMDLIEALIEVTP